ncbi:MAG: hypothetical protein NVV62_00330 [Terricaulis sp.]|nr:hypothetical protein [Terricaulis sp.]
MRQFFAAAFGAFALAACASSPAATETHRMTEDPYLWLEDIEGERALAWVREQNARSLAVLEADPRYAALYADASAIANNRDRLPLGSVRGGHYYNFWQDATHVRGIWRRATLASFSAGAPVWETLLDIDALAQAENANWVYKGANCLQNRCMVALSDGGRDAAEWREFDTETRSFVSGGFAVPTAKSSLAWVDHNTLLVATDWGEGSMTESGYAYIVKRWTRGTPLSSSVEVLRGQPSDVAVFAGVLEDVDGSRLPIAIEADTFFEIQKLAPGRRSPAAHRPAEQGQHPGAFQRQSGVHAGRSVERLAARGARLLSARANRRGRARGATDLCAQCAPIDRRRFNHARCGACGRL